MVSLGVVDLDSLDNHPSSHHSGGVDSCSNSTHGPQDPLPVAPLFALCIAGAARTFSTHLVLKSLELHLIQRLVPTRNSGLFLYLKTADSDKLEAGAAGLHFPKHKQASSSVSALDAAISETWWIRELLREVVIIKGSGAFIGRGATNAGIAANGTAAAHRKSDPWVWTNFSSSGCQPPFGSFNSSAGHRKEGAGNIEERMVLATLGLRWCGAAIERDEAMRNLKYAAVVFVRP